MKTAVKLSTNRQLVTSACAMGVMLETQVRADRDAEWETKHFHVYTPDQWGALMFGGEAALEAYDLKKARDAATA